MIMSVFMFKKVVCTIVSTLCILFLLSACNASIDDYESYQNLKVGEHFSVNRDGYAVKINDTLLVWHNLADGEKDCVKVIDKNMVDASGMIEGEDVLNGSKELLADKIKDCYSSNDYVIMELLNNDTIILVDCNNNFKYSKQELITVNLITYQSADYFFGKKFFMNKYYYIINLFDSIDRLFLNTYSTPAYFLSKISFVII